MAIQDDKTLLCKGDLKAYHESISPYLGGNLMLGTNVSDYYSTDEKIIGVWTDGRPLYQITYNFTMPAADVSYTIGTLPIFANPKQMYGGIEWDTHSYIEVNYYDSSAPTSCLCYVHNRSVQIMGRDQDLANKPAFVTVKYTKTSDAANSAVTTPGCYDVNRPDLWPENIEIYFGNGLYGYRATGNMPALAAGTDWTNIRMLTNIGTNGKTFQMGGGLETLNGNEVRAWTQLGISRSGNFESTLVVSTNGELQLGVKFPGQSHHSTTANKYDVWVTYTK